MATTRRTGSYKKNYSVEVKPRPKSEKDGDGDIVSVVVREIKAELDRRNMSDSELARQISAAPSTVSRTLDGRIKSPPFAQIIAMYNALNIPLPFPFKNAGQQQTAPVSHDQIVGGIARVLAFPKSETQHDLHKAEKVAEYLHNAGFITLS